MSSNSPPPPLPRSSPSAAGPSTAGPNQPEQKPQIQIRTLGVIDSLLKHEQNSTDDSEMDVGSGETSGGETHQPDEYHDQQREYYDQDADEYSQKQLKKEMKAKAKNIHTLMPEKTSFLQTVAKDFIQSKLSSPVASTSTSSLPASSPIKTEPDATAKQDDDEEEECGCSKCCDDDGIEIEMEPAVMKRTEYFCTWSEPGRPPCTFSAAVIGFDKNSARCMLIYHIRFRHFKVPLTKGEQQRQNIVEPESTKRHFQIRMVSDEYPPLDEFEEEQLESAFMVEANVTSTWENLAYLLNIDASRVMQWFKKRNKPPEICKRDERRKRREQLNSNLIAGPGPVSSVPETDESVLESPRPIVHDHHHQQPVTQTVSTQSTIPQSSSIVHQQTNSSTLIAQSPIVSDESLNDLTQCKQPEIEQTVEQQEQPNKDEHQSGDADKLSPPIITSSPLSQSHSQSQVSLTSVPNPPVDTQVSSDIPASSDHRPLPVHPISPFKSVVPGSIPVCMEFEPKTKTPVIQRLIEFEKKNPPVAAAALDVSSDDCVKLKANSTPGAAAKEQCLLSSIVGSAAKRQPVVKVPQLPKQPKEPVRPQNIPVIASKAPASPSLAVPAQDDESDRPPPTLVEVPLLEDEVNSVNQKKTPAAATLPSGVSPRDPRTIKQQTTVNTARQISSEPPAASILSPTKAQSARERITAAAFTTPVALGGGISVAKRNSLPVAQSNNKEALRRQSDLYDAIFSGIRPQKPRLQQLNKNPPPQPVKEAPKRPDASTSQAAANLGPKRPRIGDLIGKPTPTASAQPKPLKQSMKGGGDVRPKGSAQSQSPAKPQSPRRRRSRSRSPPPSSNYSKDVDMRQVRPVNSVSVSPLVASESINAGQSRPSQAKRPSPDSTSSPAPPPPPPPPPLRTKPARSREEGRASSSSSLSPRAEVRFIDFPSSSADGNGFDARQLEADSQNLDEKELDGEEEDDEESEIRKSSTDESEEVTGESDFEIVDEIKNRPYEFLATNAQIKNEPDPTEMRPVRTISANEEDFVVLDSCRNDHSPLSSPKAASDSSPADQTTLDAAVLQKKKPVDIEIRFINEISVQSPFQAKHSIEPQQSQRPSTSDLKTESEMKYVKLILSNAPMFGFEPPKFDNDKPSCAGGGLIQEPKSSETEPRTESNELMNDGIEPQDTEQGSELLQAQVLTGESAEEGFIYPESSESQQFGADQAAEHQEFNGYDQSMTDDEQLKQEMAEDELMKRVSQWTGDEELIIISSDEEEEDEDESTQPESSIDQDSTTQDSTTQEDSSQLDDHSDYSQRQRPRPRPSKRKRRSQAATLEMRRIQASDGFVEKPQLLNRPRRAKLVKRDQSTTATATPVQSKRPPPANRQRRKEAEQKNLSAVSRALKQLAPSEGFVEQSLILDDELRPKRRTSTTTTPGKLNIPNLQQSLRTKSSSSSTASDRRPQPKKPQPVMTAAAASSHGVSRIVYKGQTWLMKGPKGLILHKE